MRPNLAGYGLESRLAAWKNGGGQGLAIIILVAVLLRASAAVYLGNYVTDLPGTFDQISYDMLARQVLQGLGFTVAENWWPLTPAGSPTAHWSFLYTLYLAGIYGLVGYHPLVARLVQAVLAGLLMPWLTYRIGSRAFGHRAGLAAALITAVYIYFVYYAAALMTETFYIIGILWTLDIAGNLGRADGARGNWLRAGLILGVALAVTVLLRQIFLLFVPLLFGWLMWRSYRHNARPVAHMCGALAAAALILMLSILPWTARNYSAFGQFVLLNTNAGFAFFWGNHPIHGYNFIAILPPGGPTYQSLIPAELHSLNEAELDRTLLKQGLGFIQAEPGRYLVLSFSRIKDYFVFWPSARSGAISNLSRVASFGLCLPFMLYGLWLGRRSWPQASLLYLFVTAYTAIHLMVWALIRYRLPIDAVLVIFAGMAVVDIYLTVTGTRLVQAGAAALPLRPNPGK